MILVKSEKTQVHYIFERKEKADDQLTEQINDLKEK